VSGDPYASIATLAEASEGVESGAIDPRTGSLHVNISADARAAQADPYADIAQAAEDASETGEESEGGWGRDIGIGLRGLVSGLGSATDFLALATPSGMANHVAKAIGLPTGPGYEQYIQALADYIGAPKAETDDERLLESGAKGVGGAIPTIPFGGPVAALIAGGAGGLAGEATRQAGGGELAQVGASLAAGGIGSVLPGALKGGANFARALGALGPSQAEKALAERVPNSFLQAANRAGIADELLPADAGGGFTRGFSAFTAQTPFGAPPIISRAQKLNEAAGAGVSAKAASLGGAQNGETFGETVRAGILKAKDSTRRSAKALYDRAAGQAGDATVDLKKARDLVDGHIARLQATAQTGTIPAQLKDLQSLRSELERPLTVQGVRDMRTEMFVAPDLRGTPAEARLQSITQAAADDVVDSLRAQGKVDAADTFRLADDQWRERLQLIDNVIRPIIGRSKNPRSGEAVANSLNSAMRGNNARVAAFVRALPEEEQGIARASLLSPIGRDKDGAFSLSRFADDWRDIGDTAKAAVFGKELASSLDALATVGQEAKAAMKYANHSNTGRAVITERTLGSIGTGATLAAGVKTLGAALVGQYGLGRLLASPRFARWLASMPKKPNQAAALAHAGRLTAIAASEPAIASQIGEFQSRLLRAMNDNAALGRAAASGEPRQEQEGQPKP
jgi:hypothetical protein